MSVTHTTYSLIKSTSFNLSLWKSFFEVQRSYGSFEINVLSAHKKKNELFLPPTLELMLNTLLMTGLLHDLLLWTNYYKNRDVETTWSMLGDSLQWEIWDT